MKVKQLDNSLPCVLDTRQTPCLSIGHDNKGINDTTSSGFTQDIRAAHMYIKGSLIVILYMVSCVKSPVWLFEP